LSYAPLFHELSRVPPPNRPAAQSAQLEYRELGQSLTPFISGIPVALQSVPFRKEPEFGQRKIVRGLLKFGDGPNHFVPFILDRAQGQLYLDLLPWRSVAGNSS